MLIHFEDTTILEKKMLTNEWTVKYCDFFRFLMLRSESKNKNGYIEPRQFVEAHKGRSSGMKSMMFRKEVLFLLFPFYIFSLWQHMFEHHFCQESEKTWNEAWRGEKPLNNSPSLFYPLFSASFSKGRSFENNIVFKQWGKSSMINPLLFSCFESEP